MQCQSLILLAEVLHDERQTEAARFQIANQACADRPTAITVVASALRRFQVALANATVGLREPTASSTARVNTSPAISGLGADPL
jgi:hypothetical protein